MKKIVYAFAVVTALATLTFAQSASQNRAAAIQAARDAKQQYVGVASPDATTTCTYSFTSSTANKFLKYCVTKNGNIVQFQSPSGEEFISLAPAGEGYAFCDFDSATQYYDYAGYGDSGNWQPPTTLSSSATQVKIARTTTDGMYTLTQTISQSAGNALAQVSMAIKNNTTTQHHVGILRYADVDAEGFPSNNFDYTRRTAFGYNEMGYGLQLQFIAGAPFNGGFAQIIPGGPNPCQIFLHVGGPLQSTDGSIFMQYDLQIPRGATKTVVVAYKSF